MWSEAGTIEEVALALQDLGDLEVPDLPDPGVSRVQDEGLGAAAGRPRGHHELAGVAVRTVLQAHTAHLQGWKTEHVFIQ